MFVATSSHNILAGGGAQLGAQHEAVRAHGDQPTRVTGTLHQSQNFGDTEGDRLVHQSYA